MFALLSGVALLASCSESASEAEIVLAGEEAVFEQLCVCHEALSFDSETQCYTSFVARTPSETECVRQLFEAHADDIRQTVECQLEVIAEAQRCLSEVVDCVAPATNTCLVMGFVAREACGPYVDAVDHGLDVCYGVVPDE